jgi:hypothetical protein
VYKPCEVEVKYERVKRMGRVQRMIGIGEGNVYSPGESGDPRCTMMRREWRDQVARVRDPVLRVMRCREV